MGFMEYLWLKFYRNNKSLITTMLIVISVFSLYILSTLGTPPKWATVTAIIIFGIIFAILLGMMCWALVFSIAEFITYLRDEYVKYMEEKKR